MQPLRTGIIHLVHFWEMIYMQYNLDFTIQMQCQFLSAPRDSWSSRPLWSPTWLSYACSPTVLVSMPETWLASVALATLNLLPLPLQLALQKMLSESSPFWPHGVSFITRFECGPLHLPELSPVVSCFSRGWSFISLQSLLFPLKEDSPMGNYAPVPCLLGPGWSKDHQAPPCSFSYKPPPSSGFLSLWPPYAPSLGHKEG